MQYKVIWTEQNTLLKPDIRMGYSILNIYTRINNGHKLAVYHLNVYN